jgi:iron complex outermembrane receptor protein
MPVALAQGSATTAANTEKLDEVVITGSLLKREDTITPSPVTVISAEQIQNSGLTTMSDVLRAVSADNSGSIPTAFQGFAAGASGVALRGLTVNSTVVLIDGRRAAPYALTDDGQRSFVDLNTIPLDAVDHVEVLRDGASSLYGADAIAGVVNVILRKTFEGAQIGGEVGVTQHGGGGSRRVTGTLGTGNLSTDRFNAYINFEYQKDDRILVADRPFPFNTADLSSIGGNNLIGGQPGQSSGSTFGSVTPGTLGIPGDLTSGQPLPDAVAQPLRPCGGGARTTTDDTGTYCAQNLSAVTDDQPGEVRLGVLSRFTFAVNDKTEAYLAGSFFQNTVDFDEQPQQAQASTQYDTNAIALPPTLPGGSLNPNNPFASAGQYALLNYAFGDIPASLSERNRVMRVVAGIKGNVLGWDYDSALLVNHTSLTSTQRGYISFRGLLNAITTGSYNFVNPATNTPAVRAQVSPSLQKVSQTDLDSLDLRLSRSLLTLPGGPLGVGAGVEARYESQFDPDLNSNGDIQLLGLSHASGARTIYAAYAELDAPLLKQLEVDVSGRYDHYADFGGKFVPKVGFKLTPIPQLILRGTYSQGFRAPTFAENGSSSAEGSTTYTPTDPAFLAAHNHDGYVQPYTLQELTVGNPNIKPETSDSYTLGVVVQPIRQIKLSADYYYIRKKNVITQPSVTAALDAYLAGRALPAGFGIIADVPDSAAPDALPRPVVVTESYANESSLSTDGLDLELQGSFVIRPGLRFTSTADVTKIFSWKLVHPDGTSEQYAGTQGPYVVSAGAGTPRYRGSWTNTVDTGPATVSAILYYTSRYAQWAADQAPPPACLYSDAAGNPFPAGCHVPSFIDIDLTAQYRFSDHLSVTLAVENVLDRLPPLNPASYAGVNYNPAYSQAGIVGRLFRIGANYRF